MDANDPDVGHSGAIPNEASENAILAVQMSKLKAGEDKFSSAHGSLRSIIKDCEAKGLNVKLAKEAMRIKKAGNVDDKMKDLAVLFRYLRILGVPATDEQLNLFDFAMARAPIDERAFEDGLAAGRFGQSLDECPHDPSTEAYRAWREGFHVGDRERTLVLSMASPIVSHASSASESDGGGVEDEDEFEDVG